MALYTTYGHVRGLCGHRHQSESAAGQCVARDQNGCASQGGYSDRTVYTIGDDGYLENAQGSPVWPSHGRGCGAVKVNR